MTVVKSVQLRVCRALADGHSNPKRIADRTGLTLRSIQQTLTRLERAGVVEREEFTYQLTEAALEVFHAEQGRAA
jgi:DNA-binding IclR family transcriptional regulator